MWPPPPRVYVPRFPRRELLRLPRFDTLLRMSEFTIHTAETAPEASRAALEQLEANVGFVPNLAATIAGSPLALDGFVAMQSALRKSTLSGVEREVVGLTVSRANSSEYSLAAHATFARAQGAPDDVVAALLAGEPLPDARLQDLHEFTRAVLRDGGHGAASAGLTAEQKLEVITQIAYTTFANLAANVAGTPIDDAFDGASSR
jgi:AhpD family alkylhydroperoxidase